MTECNGARDRAHALAHGVAVVAALHDPSRSGPSGDDADVVAPHHHDANARLSGIASDFGPIACEPELALRHAEVVAEPPTAPAAGASRNPARPGDARPARDVVAYGTIRLCAIAMVR